MPSKVSLAKRGWQNCSHPFLRLSSTTTRLKTTTVDRDVTCLRQTRSTLHTTSYVVPQTRSNVIWRRKRNTLGKTLYDAPQTNEKYFAKRHHMTSNRQTRNTLQTTSHNVPQTNEKYFAKRHHMTSNRPTRTLQKTSYVVSQTNDKHFANDVIWRPTDKRETLWRRRHVMLSGQGNGQVKVAWGLNYESGLR